MGSHAFSCDAVGRTAQEAYNTAVNDALHEYGQDPYNGTISTTDGFRLFRKPPRVQFEKWVKHLYNEIMNDLGATREFGLDHDEYGEGIRKWGNCACVEVPRYVSKRHGVNLKRNQREYHFFGVAAS